VHRDLKPDNVIVGDGDAVKILDFGLVKLLDAAAAAIGGDVLTRTGITFGTPAYMAPEQALGRAVDGRADLYALGVILFELVTGALPFAAKEPRDLLRAHVGTPPPRLAALAGWVTPPLDALIATAMAKKPAERYVDAAAMRTALDVAVTSLP
jgi:serine/threonine protein kinase